VTWSRRTEEHGSLRPTYKVLLCSYGALNGPAPDYLSELVHSQPSTELCDLSCSLTFCSCRPHKLYVTHSDHRFVICGSMEQYALVLVFKTLLKTHLFKQPFL